MLSSKLKPASEPDYLAIVREMVRQVTADIDCTVVLFGSRARGTARRGSDIDIGFIGISEAQFVKLRDRILGELEESVVPHRVDLVNMETVANSFKKMALRDVVVWKQGSRVN